MAGEGALAETCGTLRFFSNYKHVYILQGCHVRRPSSWLSRLSMLYLICYCGSLLLARIPNSWRLHCAWLSSPYQSPCLSVCPSPTPNHSLLTSSRKQCHPAEARPGFGMLGGNGCWDTYEGFRGHFMDIDTLTQALLGCPSFMHVRLMLSQSTNMRCLPAGSCRP